MTSLKIVTAIARFTLLEAWRTRLPWIVLTVLALGLGLAEFAAGLALTDSASYRTGFYATWSRLALVLIVTLSVATSIAREFSERLIDLTLSRPVARSHWYLGRLLGVASTAILFALIAALPLTLTSSPLAALAWGVSLAAELVLVAAATLTCAVALAQVTPVVLAVAAFYLLSRSISAIVLMSHGPLVAPMAWSSKVIAEIVGILELLLPRLDRYTQASWLHDSTSALAALPALGVQTLIYVLLLAAVGLFDFSRRDA